VQVVAFNNSGTITYVSENIKDILPTTHEELLNQKISVLNNYLPEDGGYRNVDLTKQFYDGQKYLSPMMTSTNTINWIEWSCKIFSDNVRVILGQNVSDRMELESTYELLVENAEDMIYQCDVHGTLQFVNTRMIDLLKTPKEELVGSNSIDFVHPDYKNAVLEHYKEHFDNRKNSSYFEFPIVSKTGEVRWVGQHVTTLFGASGKGYVNGFLALARDITEKRDQQNIIEEQKNDITSSITYAQRIQVNLLPIEQQFEESFEEHFVIYRPKDIVSGDFYWLHRVENKTVIALGDCTGHGVPGAFMTLLGINILNSLVLENRITEPAQILNEMDKKLVQAIKSGNESLKDGMEITICTYDNDTGMLSYACAGSRFLIFENRGFNMFKGDIKHIGDDMLPEFRGFVSHYIPLGKESIVYLLTDGFQDQFGGIKNKRFSFRRLLELFESNTRLPLSEQKNMIEEEFDKWKLQFEQTDDVTIIAFKGPKD
jgi:PAS domain S-box-containing protein